MRRTAAAANVLLVLIAASFGAAGFALYDRFTSGARTRVALCENQNVIKKILHDEHQKKLERAQAFKKKHPHGAGIFTIELINQGIADEKKIVRETLAAKCK